jgi:hypothetical protein
MAVFSAVAMSTFTPESGRVRCRDRQILHPAGEETSPHGELHMLWGLILYRVCAVVSGLIVMLMTVAR